jgi:hypothetical protein
MSYFLLCSDLATALVGPFKSIADANKHREFLEERGDADPGVIIHEDELHLHSPDYTITPEEDLEQ